MLRAEQEPCRVVDAAPIPTTRSVWRSPRRGGYADAAAYLGIKVSTLRSMVSRGQVPHYRYTARLVAFDLDELAAFVANSRVEAKGGDQ